MVMIDQKPPPEELEAQTQSQPQAIPPPAYPAASSSTLLHHNPTAQAPIRPPIAAAYPPPGGGSYNDRANPYGNQWLADSYRSQYLRQCTQGDHDVTTSFGLCGIICAILLFPFGLMCLIIDTEKKCARCGRRID